MKHHNVWLCTQKRLVNTFALSLQVGLIFPFFVSTQVKADTLYCLHDADLNDSQFCYGTPLPQPVILPLGPVYEDCDIEALDLQQGTETSFMPQQVMIRRDRATFTMFINRMVTLLI
jgi:hypothetical protein